MTKQEFKELTVKETIMLDGATGSNLQKRGMPSGVCPEKWIAENEDVLIGLQKEYIEAGSNIVYAPTFSANRIKLKEFGLENEVVELNCKLVKISKKAAGTHAYVAGDLTMCGQQLEPLGSLTFDELVDAYKEQIKVMDSAGADLLVIETMMSLQETRAALLAVKEVSSLPVMVTMSFGEDGKTLYGTDARTAAIVLEGLGADAVGINCSAGPDKMLTIVKDMKQVSHLPIIAKPNAGMPKLGEDGKTAYDMGADEFAEHMLKIAKAGAVMLGGCCGTDPSYINKTKRMIENAAVNESASCEKTYITSERKTVAVEYELDEICIDIRGDEELQDDIANSEFDTIYDILDEIEEEQMVRICMDGLEGKTVVKQLIQEVSGYTTLPLCFETDNVELLEAALYYYCGRAGIKCSDKEFMTKMTKKYGAVVL